MQITGFDSFIIALTDDTGKIKTDNKSFNKNGLFYANASTSKGATQFNIQNISPAAQAIYGSDLRTESSVGVAAPTATFGANDLPIEITAALLGAGHDDTNKGYAVKRNKLVNAALVGVTHLGENKFYWAFPFGTVTQSGGMNWQTNNQNEVLVHDVFQFAAQARPADDLLYQFFSSGEAGFTEEAMLTHIFQGYTATAAPGVPGAAASK